MYRALTWVGVFALCSTLTLGGLLFTKIGNTILLPFAQSTLNHFLPDQPRDQCMHSHMISACQSLITA